MYNIPANVGKGTLSNNIDHLQFVLQILNLKGHQNCIIGFKVMVILVRDFSTFGNIGNLNLTSESAQISTSWFQTPEEG